MLGLSIVVIVGFSLLALFISRCVMDILDALRETQDQIDHLTAILTKEE